ncbi:bifunctional phosphopantothenoylcysteine decarboxylase/phosphopantothenate--cysteine ligase CoaBC [Parasporobacterium paucivorans]|uniref:Coenzyme A biosynthesis bifunctional protein CoaBC n=1 Tax=Parasporobacterium paucivorans DSM 15970 TaxID=1122934 RepID=A0A1M6ALG2_9FIRM|nr:bifunctional phosphopantothenoylcysteine decarboxylase/phosphopantothenate--cysteine ligase CoaBC [Parasporobacterium paucivorans]SHI37295.1 phosphopantothenoylcysteine decarboxylase / phosphopantothenate--cysteine ligase [Parasporobacterium paucivorans DSM 15970]
MLKGKTVILGVTGSIAAYKIANLASMLVKLNCSVHVIMSKNATNFINPITFETLTGNKCLVDTFDRGFDFEVEHISLAKKADLFLVAPAGANAVGKIANGIADDMLTTTFMACRCKKLIAPVMNSSMLENPILQENLKKLRGYEYGIICPEVGRLACGDTGAGKLPAEGVLLDHILREIHYQEKDMSGIKMLISAGATVESIDPVRFVSNRSTGKMGYALARCAMERGADVTVVAGHTSVEAPSFVTVIKVESAEDMFEIISEMVPSMDVVIKAAAVADYMPENYQTEKLKKSEMDLTIRFVRTRDILGYLGEQKKPGQFLCGFSMETENLIENSKAKLIKKNLDMIVANNLKEKGAGFGVDTNVVTIITKNGQKHLPIMSKDEVACNVLDEILRIRTITDC